MSVPVSRLGLRTRIALALAAVAVVSVVLSTVLANRGLGDEVDRSAHARLQEAADHLGELAGDLRRDAGGWTPGVLSQLDHVAASTGLRLAVRDAAGRRITTDVAEPEAVVATVVQGRRAVGSIRVAPIDPKDFGRADADLHHRLNRLHLLAGALALLLGIAVALVLAGALARPLRRLTDGARSLERGDLATRMPRGGGPEIDGLALVLDRLASTLEREDMLRREAAADIAHELRTPVNGLLGRIEAAQDALLPPGPNLDGMHDEALRLARLVEDLGRLAEAQQPGLLMARAPVDLAPIVRGRCDAAREDFAARKIDLETQLARVVVAGDPQRLGQIVDNLLSNALRYTDPGGTVTVTVLPGDEQGVLRVRDTGIGIPAEDLPNVFQRFWRGERSRARTSGGAGIGLAIVDELVQAHGGRVEVASTPGQGTEFAVFLPSLPAVAGGSSGRPSRGGQAGS